MQTTDGGPGHHQPRSWPMHPAASFHSHCSPISLPLQLGSGRSSRGAGCPRHADRSGRVLHAHPSPSAPGPGSYTHPSAAHLTRWAPGSVAIGHVRACRSHVAAAPRGGATPRRASRGPRHELLGRESPAPWPRAQPRPRALAYRAASALPARGKGTTGFPGRTSRASGIARLWSARESG